VKLSRVLGWIGGPAIAVILLWFSFRGVQLDELLEQIRHANPLLLGLSLCAVPLFLTLRAWRWRILLSPVRAQIPMSESFSATAIGYLAGLLPGKVGEVLRPALLSRRLRLPFAPVLATVGVERVILDLLTVLFLGALALLLPSHLTGLDAGEASTWLPRFQRLAAVVLGLAILALFLLHLAGRHREVIGERLDRAAESAGGRIIPPTIRWLASLLPGFAALSSWRGLLLVVGQSLLIWLVTAAGMHAGIAACGVEIPPGGMLILLPVLVAGISIPTPGNTGTFHLAMKLGLMSFFEVDESIAVGTSLIVHLVNWSPLIVAGAVSIAFGGMRAPRENPESITGPGNPDPGHETS
jgi:uncharacterized protein (TIRG00374 family)